MQKCGLHIICAIAAKSKPFDCGRCVARAVNSRFHTFIYRPYSLYVCNHSRHCVACRFERIYDFCLVWPSEKSQQSTMVHSCSDKLEHCFVRIPFSSPGKSNRLFTAYSATVKDYAGSYNSRGLCSLHRFLYATAAQT